MEKILSAPVENVSRLQAELVIVKNLAVYFVNPQIFLYAAGTTQKQSPATFHSATKIFSETFYI